MPQEMATPVLVAVAVVTVETITVERRMRPRQLSPITERTNNVRWYYHGARSTRRTRTTRQEQEQEGVNDRLQNKYKTECATTERRPARTTECTPTKESVATSHPAFEQ